LVVGLVLELVPVVQEPEPVPVLVLVQELVLELARAPVRVLEPERVPASRRLPPMTAATP
jgi:hypothetical protein